MGIDLSLEYRPTIDREYGLCNTCSLNRPIRTATQTHGRPPGLPAASAQKDCSHQEHVPLQALGTKTTQTSKGQYAYFVALVVLLGYIWPLAEMMTDMLLLEAQALFPKINQSEGRAWRIDEAGGLGGGRADGNLSGRCF